MTTDITTRLAPVSEAELAEIIVSRFRAQQPMRITGGGTRVRHQSGEQLNTSKISGVVTYEPGEMTLIARTGTSLPEIQEMLASEGQALAFEPPDMRRALGGNGTPTIGGVVAANASGPRRVMAGACRDHLLGVRFVDGQGRVMKNGGRVMKNVTGLDLTKLQCGAFGTLGVLTEVALKTLPHAHSRATLAFPELDEAGALRIFSAALATPFEITGAAFLNGTAWLRIEGLPQQLAYRQKRLLEKFSEQNIELLDEDATRTLWQDLRDVTHFGTAGTPLWRILVKPTDAPAICASLRQLGGSTSLDWGGGLIWYSGPGEAVTIRRIAHHASMIRGSGAESPAFPPVSATVARISEGLRRTFDPAGILNPGLMDS